MQAHMEIKMGKSFAGQIACFLHLGHQFRSELRQSDLSAEKPLTKLSIKKLAVFVH